VEISGEIPLKEVAERMRRSDALLLFSRYENFPCVIPEAWASGIPVLSTDVGGIREYLTDEKGTLIPSEDESALAQTLIQWAQHPNQFNAQSLREYAESMFSVDAVAQAYDDVYREAITRQIADR
jgi:glycosyltransferase involved in cell wall biosynthesis